ncbi:MAG TPA: asparaginase [Candidatus Baltobacteraceae bacterium]|nr:asparaginase [Candidatus Baltobacteraceae bacterium]
MLVNVTRGDLVESVHHVAACAADARGNVIFSDGDIEAPVFLRSSAKPFIAAAALAAGVREAFDLDMREIAVMCASHIGQPFHVEAVASILRKIGLGVDALQCGTHLPYSEESAKMLIRAGEKPSALYNNCSGKHAGILAMCRVTGADIATYLEVEHPVQQAILAFCARLSDDDPATWPLGVDGCGIPVYATGLRSAAMAFARLASLTELESRDAMALLAARDAMVSYPEYVAGTGEFDSVLMEAAGGGIACKVGAEGVHGVACIPQGIGFASKVLDGSSRARPPVTMAALRALGVKAAGATELEAFARPIVYNRAGRRVGEIRVAANFAVEQASR